MEKALLDYKTLYVTFKIVNYQIFTDMKQIKNKVYFSIIIYFIKFFNRTH